MALTNPQKRAAGKWWIYHAFSNPNATATVHKDDIVAALDAVDAWFTTAPDGGSATNQVSLNNALPAAAKNNLSTTQKELLLAAVVLARAGEI